MKTMARILIIDDQPAIRTALRAILEREGHAVTEAVDGHVALRHFAGDPTDLVITDVFMPNMDGIEFLTRVKGAFPEARIVVMSGGGSLSKEEVLADAGSLGALATLPKPFTSDELTHVVAQALAVDGDVSERAAG